MGCSRERTCELRITLREGGWNAYLTYPKASLQVLLAAFELRMSEREWRSWRSRKKSDLIIGEENQYEYSKRGRNAYLTNPKVVALGPDFLACS